MKINVSKCNGCGACKTSCAVEAISLGGGKASIDNARCIKCRMCLVACPAGAVKI